MAQAAAGLVREYYDPDLPGAAGLLGSVKLAMAEPGGSSGALQIQAPGAVPLPGGSGPGLPVENLVEPVTESAIALTATM